MREHDSLWCSGQRLSGHCVTLILFVTGVCFRLAIFLILLMSLLLLLFCGRVVALFVVVVVVVVVSFVTAAAVVIVGIVVVLFLGFLSFALNSLLARFGLDL